MRSFFMLLLVLVPITALMRVEGGQPSAEAGAATDFTLALDCDFAFTGVQSVCDAGVGPLDVAVVLTNNTGSPMEPGSFVLFIDNADTSRLIPSAPPCIPPFLDCNPDADQAALGGSSWACGPVNPDPDTGAGGPGTSQSFISCFNGVGDAAAIPAGGSVRLAVVHYDVPSAALHGSVALSLSASDLFDDTFMERGSCNPVITVAMTCEGVTVTTNSYEMAVDCDATVAGVQSTCNVAPGTSITTAVVVKNNTATPLDLVAFDFELLNSNSTRLIPPAVPAPCGGFYYDCNPDFNQSIGGTAWSCFPVAPDNDTGAGGPGTTVSFISCFDGADPYAVVPPGGSVPVAFVRYNVPAMATAGSTNLSFFTNVGDVLDGQFKSWSCHPLAGAEMTCTGATVNVTTVSLALDCNVSQPMLQTRCYVSNLQPTYDVDIMIRNSTNIVQTIGDVHVEVRNPDSSRLLAVQGAVCFIGLNFNCNPDFNENTFTSPAGWTCSTGGPPPSPDEPPAPAGQQNHYLDCAVGMGFGTVLGAGTSARLAQIHYNTPASPPGSVILSFSAASGGSDVRTNSPFFELGSCPTVTTAMACASAEVIFFCPIDQGDVNNDGRVNSIDLALTAQKFGMLPAPQVFDQNFDSAINSIDLALIAQQFNKFVTDCP